MSKLRKPFMLSIYILGLLILFQSAFDWYGFGVDTYGRVYVGARDVINVLDEGENVRTITVPPHRSYYFTVQTDGNILIATNSRVYVVDYYGNILSSEYESNDTTYTALMHLQSVETVNGDQYWCRNILGRRVIEDEDGNEVYIVPFIQYLSSIVNMLPFALIATIIFLSEWTKANKIRNQ